MFSKFDDFSQNPVIKVFGIGGGGGNAINRMIENDVKGVEFVAINTDAQALRHSKAFTRIQIGKKLTRGLGAGAKPNVGRDSAIEDSDEIKAALEGTDMVFLTCGMGGGTGTGAIGVIAEIAKNMGVLTVAVVTKPFSFEGPRRMADAIAGLELLKPHVDSLVVIPNEKLRTLASNDMPLLEAFRESDNVLRRGVQGLAEIINVYGLINVDFADVKTVFQNKGSSLMGIGAASGEHRAIRAAREAMKSRLLEISIDGATDAIVILSADVSLTIFEAESALAEIRNATEHDLNIIWGTTINHDLEEEFVCTIIATGYELKAKENDMEELAANLYRYQEETTPIYDHKVKQAYSPNEEKPKNNSLPEWLRKKK